MKTRTLGMVMTTALFTLSAIGADKASSQPNVKELDGGKWGFQPAQISVPSLPQVLLIGDSILIGYRTAVIRQLAGKANVNAWPNPFFQFEKLNRELVKILEHGPYDVVHVNNGLHRWQPGRIKPEAFEPLTRAYILIIRDKMPRAGIIWANTTLFTLNGKPTELDPVKNGRMPTSIV